MSVYVNFFIHIFHSSKKGKVLPIFRKCFFALGALVRLKHSGIFVNILYIYKNAIYPSQKLYIFLEAVGKEEYNNHI